MPDPLATQDPWGSSRKGKGAKGLGNVKGAMPGKGQTERQLAGSKGAMGGKSMPLGKGMPMQVPRLCRHFARTGQCTYPNCRFVHVRPKSGGVLAQFGIGSGDESLDEELGGREHLGAADAQGVYTWDDIGALGHAAGGIGTMMEADNEVQEEHDGDPNGLGLGLGLNCMTQCGECAVPNSGEQTPASQGVMPKDLEAVEMNLRESMYSLEDRILDKMTELVQGSADCRRRA